MPSWTRIRLEHTHVLPACLNWEVMAPATAASKSASSNTMKGALPPSSSDRRFTVSAQSAIRRLPTAVEPVNDNLRTIGFLQSSAPTAGRSEEHTSELQSLMRTSYAVFCLQKKKKNTTDKI